MSLRNEICKETCIVVDRSSKFLETSGSKLDIEQNSKSRGSLSFLSDLYKTTWTCIVEGVVEYCRIVYDIFPPSFKISVCCSDEVVTDVNTFALDNQCVQQVLKGFGDIGPPKEPEYWESAVSIYPGVAQAAERLLKGVKENSACTRRLIVITPLEDESDSNSISNVVWEIQNQQDKGSICHMELVVVNISMRDDNVFKASRQVSTHLNVKTITFKHLQCSNKLSMLTRQHYNLRSTIITGIPMKEEQNAGTSANYDVELIHSAAAHHEVDGLTPLINTSGEDVFCKPPVTLKWCTPKASTLQDLQPCVGAYRITPAEVNSRPAACLVMFLLQGRTVMLEEPKKSGAKVLTHMLQSHGGDIYIHVLVAGRSPLDDPPSITEGIGGRVTDYRVNDFGKLMKENRLAPYSEEDAVEANKKAISRLERFSKHWPMVISDTLIFNMQSNLDPLLPLLLKPTLTEEEVQDCKKVIYRLQAMESRSEALPLPIVTLKGKGTKKEEQYKQVWSELDMFIEGASATSFMHKKVLDCIRGTQETPSEAKAGEDKKLVEKSANDASWNDLDRYQQMTEREKKAYNEAPSDPRRRRRTSEGSSTKQIDAQSQPSKKSPRQDEPLSKVRRMNTSRTNVTNVAATLQPKSSLLSIWTNHINLTASRLHEEFFGRKQSENGKYELYKKEQDQASQDIKKTYNSKPVKEWV